ncbi:polymer-forming cytoskeletal protein [Comamonas aquatica]|uniref:bactofilin family protein n=1 Tax=Comamonas aquatica TaxID=225991 RepID=UPI0022DE45E0|nr:polymer-forming cytoskeletal protein [Comamonas aquatica]MDH1901702.1 polymer-forming cytoskeletal protein [Comamonas aquatica]WBM41574.1 polymer-forming cytoskeletal protein [Comamonas aquatica]
MAVNNPFFTKRDTQNFATRPGTVGSLNSTLGNGLNSHTPVAEPQQPRAVAPEVSAAPATTDSPVAEQGGSKLTVGPNIKLKGVEITDCDTLVVEGTVEATMDSRVIHIAQQGAFHGSAEIDIAEIHGEFTGALTVRQKLVIHSTGKVSGKIRYGKLVVEEGGQLAGEVEVGVGGRAERATVSTPAAKPAAQIAVA